MQKIRFKLHLGLGYEGRTLLFNIFIFFLFMLIIPAIIWGILFWLYPLPLTQLLWAIFLVGYYLFAIFLLYVLFPRTYRMIRRVFFGIGSDEDERALAEGALTDDGRSTGSTYIDANRIVAQKGREAVMDDGMARASSADPDDLPPPPPRRYFSGTQGFCPSCGEPVRPTDKQCGKCATKLSS